MHACGAKMKKRKRESVPCKETKKKKQKRKKEEAAQGKKRG